MKCIKVIDMKSFILFIACILCCSCASYVSIAPKGVSDQHVDITAIGKKSINEYKDVSLPYKLKVSELPLRVSVKSSNCLYSDFTITGDKVSVGSGISSLTLGLITGGCAAGCYSLASEGGIVGVSAIIGGVGAAFATPMFLLAGARMLSSHPDNKSYYIESKPLTSNNNYLNDQNWLFIKDVVDVYVLLGDEQYNIACNKVNYLLNKQQTGELYYLRGQCYLYLSNYKKALNDFNKALTFDDASNMKNDIYNCIEIAENERALQLQRRRDKWTSVAAAFVGIAGSVATNIQSQKYQQNMGVYGNGSNDYLLNPNYIKVQYLQETNNGQTMTFEQWLSVKASVKETPSINSEPYNNSYNSNSSNPTRIACTACKYTNGKCPVCKGSGRISDNSFGISQTKQCNNCGGYGLCPICGGDGWR